MLTSKKLNIILMRLSGWLCDQTQSFFSFSARESNWRHPVCKASQCDTTSHRCWHWEKNNASSKILKICGLRKYLYKKYFTISICLSHVIIISMDFLSRFQVHLCHMHIIKMHVYLFQLQRLHTNKGANCIRSKKLRLYSYRCSQ